MLKFGGSGSGGGALERPVGVATDPSGDVWVADTGHNRVQEFSSKGEFVREFGAEGKGDGEFSSPDGIAVNSAGNVYVADSGNNRVQEFNSKGEFVRAFSVSGSGNDEYNELTGITVDGEGHVWVVEKCILPGFEECKARVQEFTGEGTRIVQFGSEGKGAGQLEEPRGIAVDSKGNVWVADTGNNRVQEFKSTGEFVRAFGSKGTGNGQFEAPTGVAIDSEGDPWVVDHGNNRVQRFTSEGSYLSQVGKTGNENGQFNKPEGIAIDGSGNIWVADTGNNRVQEGQPQPSTTTTYGYDQTGDLTSIERPEGESKPKIEDTYAYNGEGLRTSQTINGTTSYYAWDMAEELPLILSDGTNSYIYGPNGLPIEQINNTTGAVTYLHHDQAGSTRLLTGSTGKTEATFTYGAYGELTGSTGTATTPLGYDGQYTSSDTGLIYLRNRVYDPSTAQFLSVDPLVKLTGAPYNYAGDNPVNEGDPTGLLGWSEIGQAVGVGLVCVATDGAGCVAAGLADLDANVVSNDYEAVAESCRAGEEESSSLTDLAGFALGAGVGGLADGSLSEEARKALESTSAGQAALKQLVGLGAGSSVLTTLAYAQGHESSGSSCSCGK